MITVEAQLFFYTAIATVVACGISILGAFVLFMLQEINTKIQQRGHAFAGAFKHDFERELKRALDAGDYEGYDRMVDQFHNMKGSYKQGATAHEMEDQILNMQSLYHLKKQKGIILKDLKIVVYLTGGLLVFALVMIPLCDMMHKYPLLMDILVLFTVWWTIASVAYLGKIIKDAVK